MPRSKHRRKSGAKSVPHPGRSASARAPQDEIIFRPRFADGRRVNASNADEWLEEAERLVAARYRPADDPELTPDVLMRVARAVLELTLRQQALEK